MWLQGILGRKEAATITAFYCNLDEIDENNLDNLFCSDEAKENSLHYMAGKVETYPMANTFCNITCKILGGSLQKVNGK